eukprot:670669-Rhodomonas_salina.2
MLDVSEVLRPRSCSIAFHGTSRSQLTLALPRGCGVRYQLRRSPAANKPHGEGHHRYRLPHYPMRYLVLCPTRCPVLSADTTVPGVKEKLADQLFKCIPVGVVCSTSCEATFCELPTTAFCGL